jgi:acetyltransferase-like isoleucine patch superfamily enzyme
MTKPVFIHPSALVHPNAQIGPGTRVWAFVNVQEDAVIGEGCNICDTCFVEKGVVIGNHVTVKNGVSVFQGITLQDDVFIGANVAFINDRYPRSHRQDAWVLEPTTVRKGATIGTNATILCGLQIGEYAFIGAGSVVIRDVPAYTLVVGNPAKAIGFVCRCGRKLSEDLTCRCQLSYELQDGQLQLRNA